MRTAAAMVGLVGLAGVGALAGQGLADTIPVPTLPSTTVPLPKLPVPPPTVTVPVVTTTPSPSLPPITTSVPTLPEAPQTTTLGGSPSGGSLGGTLSGTSPAGGSNSGSGAQSSSSSSSGSGDRASVPMSSSRSWIRSTGPKRQRAITLTFVLPRATRVIFTVTQVSPVCQVVGRFAVKGHAGLNRVRFAGRIGPKPLEAGTYKITARTLGGRSLDRVTLVVVDGGPPSRSQLTAARASNVCPATRSSASPTGSIGAFDTGLFSTPGSRTGQPSASGPSRAPDVPSGGVLASAVEQTARAIRPALVALLAAAIILLGLASLPRFAVVDPRLNDLLARHRVEIASVGTAALVGVGIALLLG